MTGPEIESHAPAEFPPREQGWNLQEQLIELASARDQTSRQWVRFGFGAALAHLEQVDSLLAWSAAAGLWTWNSATPRTEILLTDSGFVTAKDVLSEDGWLGANRLA